MTPRSAPDLIPGPTLVAQRRISNVQNLIDRAKQLKALPRPLSPAAAGELSRLLACLQNQLIDRQEVVKFSLTLGRRRFPTAQFFLLELAAPSQCALCDKVLTPGTKVLFARSIGEAVCLACPLDFDGVY
ncbi:MAG: hypothetical protein C5B53_04770 [Candidatus Melainabacteria bacterium]|nr:MAG: hypothetical protein C5B53_04770 [Candidatus Melainabacteria bacterium]